MEQLRDIRGLQSVSAWPLAIGWWLIIGLLSILAIVGIVYAYKKYRYNQSWQGKAFKSLSNMEQNLHTAQLRPIVHALSEQIRHIAICKGSRKHCAGLTANEWLVWLQDNDPHGFLWTRDAQMIIFDQYAPDSNYSAAQVQQIIAAAKGWVARC